MKSRRLKVFLPEPGVEVAADAAIRCSCCHIKIDFSRVMSAG